METGKCRMCSPELRDHLFCGGFFLLFRYNVPALVEGDQVVIRNPKEEHSDSVNLQGPLTAPLGLLTFEHQSEQGQLHVHMP